MLKKTVVYKDFNDEEVSEDLFFHLSMAELIELETAGENSLSESLNQIVTMRDQRQIVPIIKKIIMTAYGQKSADGRRFIKNQQLRDEFESSQAYSAFFMELLTNTDLAAEFINGIVPADMAEQAARMAKAAGVPEAVTSNIKPTTARVITPEEFRSMSKEELAELAPQLASGEVLLPE